MSGQPLIAIGLVDAIYISPAVPKELRIDDDGLRYEYVGEVDNVIWDITTIIDEYYPYSFNDIVDPYWNEEGEYIYKEVLKRVNEHPDLRVTVGSIVERKTNTYKPYLLETEPLYVRFPVVLRASFDYDSYHNESDCWYEIRGVPDLSHLEDLLPKENI